MPALPIQCVFGMSAVSASSHVLTLVTIAAVSDSCVQENALNSKANRENARSLEVTFWVIMVSSASVCDYS